MTYNDIPMPLPGFIALDWSLMTLALGFVMVRLALRYRLQTTSKAAKLSDIFVVCSWLSALVLVGINTWKNSLRQRYIHWPAEALYFSVPIAKSGHLLKMSFISLFFIYIALWFSKAAFLAFYWELFSLQGRRIRLVIIAASVFAFCTFMVQLLMLGLWCNPVSGNWNTAGHLCSAVHSIQAVTVMTFTNVATDLILLAIPISTLAGIRMGRIELSGLFFTFLIGSLSIVAALARFVVLEIVEKYGGASITHTIDVLSLIEIVASIIAVCLPSFRLFLRKYRDSFRSSMASIPRTVSPSRSSTGSVQSSEPKINAGLAPLVTARIQPKGPDSYYMDLLPTPLSEYGTTER